jgi:hypothetical protein
MGRNVEGFAAPGSGEIRACRVVRLTRDFNRHGATPFCAVGDLRPSSVFSHKDVRQLGIYP